MVAGKFFYVIKLATLMTTTSQVYIETVLKLLESWHACRIHSLWLSAHVVGIHLEWYWVGLLQRIVKRINAPHSVKN